MLRVRQRLSSARNSELTAFGSAGLRVVLAPKRLVRVVGLLATLAGAALPSTVSADSRPPCGTTQEPNCKPTARNLSGAKKCRGGSKLGGLVASDIYVRRVSCSTVKRAMRTKQVRTFAPVLPGWRCKRVGVVYEGGTYRCTKGAGRTQFDVGV